MNDALLLVAIMVGVALLLGDLSEMVRNWRAETVERETEERMRREMAEWALNACRECPHRLWLVRVAGEVAAERWEGTG